MPAAAFYTLGGDEAMRTGEAEGGIRRLDGLDDAPGVLGEYLKVVRSFGENLYPGSPLIAARLLRAQDRLVAIEKQAAEADGLKDNLRLIAGPHLRAEEGDGYARLAALLPPAGAARACADRSAVRGGRRIRAGRARPSRRRSGGLRPASI